MIIPQKIIVDTKLVVLECSDAVQLFWGLEKGMSLFDVFCEDICLAYQKYISAAEIASFSFSNKQVFALKEELIALDNDHYEIKITLPLSVYTALSAERIQFLNELPIAASIQNRSGEILYANQKSQAVYGRTEEIVGSGSGDARWRVQNQKGEDLYQFN